MPIINEVKGIRWHVSHDLSGGLAARMFDVAYTKVNAVNVWDSGQYDAIELYRGESDPDLIRIKAEWDGDERDVILGIVDRSGREQTDDGVGGFVSGRDKAALVLDRYPSAAFTLQGNTVVNNALVPGLTYKQAVEQVATQAGLTVVWNIGTDNYNLGRSVAVTTDQTFGEVIALLLAPWRFGEKYSHDAWVSDDGLTLNVVRRGLLGSVNVAFQRLTVNRYEKRALPIVNDVRVEGQSYETVVSSTMFSSFCDPLTPETITRDFDGQSPSQSYTETTQIFRNTACQITEVKITQAYKDNLRTVVKRLLFMYWLSPGNPIDGKVKTQTYEHRDTNGQIGSAQRINADGTQSAGEAAQFSHTSTLRESMTKKFDYYGDNGDAKTTDEEHRKFENPVIGPGVPLKIVSGWDESNRTYKQFIYVRGKGQTHRIVAVQNYRIIANALSPTGQEVQCEIPPYEVTEQVTSAVAQGSRQQTVTLSAGVTGSKRLERSELLGDDTSIALIRTRLVEEQNLKVVEATISALPDHLIKPGWTLVIEGKPAWFDISSLYVLSSDIEGDERGALMTLRCIGFLS